ncbi:MAG: hypothetical protein M3Z66_11460, partial [Chloroflexota bacterium]|nr:hypothetical protein [Chloroflexota bacterium]
LVSLPALLYRFGRFGPGLAWDPVTRRRMPLSGTGDALFLAAVLQPLMGRLVAPLELRGPLLGIKTVEEQLVVWADVDVLLGELQVPCSPAIDRLRPGTGWSRLNAAEQLDAKRGYIEALAPHAGEAMARSYRATCIRHFVGVYSRKANNQGQATRKQVVATASMKRIMAGFFLGDWLDTLDYLGATPHPKEEIVTALPRVTLRSGGRDRAEKIAQERDIPIERLEKIAGALWKRSGGRSPIEVRVTVLQRYWAAFEEIHERQTTGMPSLWGLVRDHGSPESQDGGPDWYHPDQYRELLSSDLVADIEQLWNGKLLPRWPATIVTEPFPHALMAETFGPALRFWQGCALTAWFFCEGPISRTDMYGLRGYYHRALAALEQYETPIAEALFDELIAAQERLGPAESVIMAATHDQFAIGPSLTAQRQMGTRREGFEILRDIVTRHRRAWADNHLDRYLQSRWESEVTEAHHAYHRLFATNGKPPSVKSFASRTADAVNRWCGGDIASLYTAMGEQCPMHPTRRSLMPENVTGLYRAILKHLSIALSIPEGQWIGEAEIARQRAAALLARNIVLYFQFQEALGRPPELKDFGRKLDWPAKALDMDREAIWQAYVAAIRDALSDQTII